MAGIAIGGGMCAQKRKPVIGMEFGDVVHQPTVGGMAAPAIIANGIAMYIGMAGNTGGVRFGKHQSGMARPTICIRVCAAQCKVRICIVVECLWGRFDGLVFCFRHFIIGRQGIVFPKRRWYVPVVRQVAGRAVHLHRRSVRALSQNTAAHQ